MAVLGSLALACSERRKLAAWAGLGIRAGLGIQAALVWAGRVDTAGRAVRVLYSAAVDTVGGLTSPLWLWLPRRL